jgi:hypothetical protein
MRLIQHQLFTIGWRRTCHVRCHEVRRFALAAARPFRPAPAPAARLRRGSLFLAPLLCLFALAARAQNDYEIQVYESETVAPGSTMVELHSNFTGDGSHTVINGVLPSTDAEHETLEITHGWTPWFETGFYVFSSIQPAHGWNWVGDHLRPRVRVPESWHWPVGLSLSVEGGYQQPAFCEDTWNLELRPIIDKKIGPWYFAINPALEKSLKGYGAGEGWGFSPAVKISYDVTKVVALGVEYYAGLGPITHFSDYPDQQHQIFPTLDLNFSEAWEFNLGFGFGLTRTSDNLLLKMILGRRF